MINRQSIDIENVFASLPNEEFWKLVIDKDQWEEGEDVFDKDQSPGYLANCLRGFYCNFLCIEKPLTIELIIGLHLIAIHDKKDKHAWGPAPGVLFGFDLSCVTEKGLVELIDKIKAQPSHFEIATKIDLTKEFHLTNSIPFILEGNSNELAKQILANLKRGHWPEFVLTRTSCSGVTFCQKLIDRYHKEIFVTQTETDKLKAIIRFIQDIHQFHLFADGNGRTFIFLLLNKLLIMNHLSPTILDAPHRFNGYSVDELIVEIKNGQSNFKKLCIKTDAKKESLMTYLHVKSNFDENELNDYLCMIDFNKYYQDCELSFDVLDKLKLYLPVIYNPKTIKHFFKYAGLSKDDIQNAITSGIYYGNNFLIDTILKKYGFWLREAATDYIISAMYVLDLDQFKKLLTLKMIYSEKIYSELINKNAVLFEYILHWQKFDLMQEVLNLLDDDDFSNLLTQKHFDSKTGLDLIRSANDKQLLESCEERLSLFDKTKSPQTSFSAKSQASSFKSELWKEPTPEKINAELTKTLIISSKYPK